jgi:hypothetical protein
MMQMMNIGLFIQLIIIYLCVTPDARAEAFPGAEGAGKYTSGGRGGEVIEVTSLSDDGPGSLRYALSCRGPRLIIFRISGTIELESDLEIKEGDLTVAGQTAPGGGICLKGYPLIIDADNVVIRYLRVRLGDLAGQPYDAISCIGHKDIIVDHCSFSWGVDECASFYDNQNLTLQWCIISESLNKSVHPKGNHGYGGIWGGMQASFHHNILAHHTSRLPRFQGSRNRSRPHNEIAELCNNIIYNWTNKCTYGGEEGNYNITGNIYKPGPATPAKKTYRIIEPFEPFGRFYVSGNYIMVNGSPKAYNWKDYLPGNEKWKAVISETPASIHHTAACEEALSAYTRVLRYAGDCLVRDSVDSRIAGEVENGTFHYGDRGIIDTQDQVGGWPSLMTGEAPEDSDHDGMPDTWETANNLDPADYGDRNGHDLDNDYTNIEHYLNALVSNFY